MNIIKKYLRMVANDGSKAYLQTLFSLLEENKNAAMIDCGCGDGFLTKKFAQKINTNKVFGIEIWDKQAKLAQKKGIKVINTDLNKKLPIKDHIYDVVILNQVFEHIYEIDEFITELKRIVKLKGYIIICTPNLSSWQDIFSLILGWQPFSLSNVSTKIKKLNPIDLWQNKDLELIPHVRLFAQKGLIKLFKIGGFKIDNLKGLGYPPLIGYPARIMEKLDPSHCTYTLMKLRS